MPELRVKDEILAGDEIVAAPQRVLIEVLVDIRDLLLIIAIGSGMIEGDDEETKQ